MSDSEKLAELGAAVATAHREMIDAKRRAYNSKLAYEGDTCNADKKTRYYHRLRKDLAKAVRPSWYERIFGLTSFDR